MKMKIVLLTALLLAFSSIGFAQFPSAGSAHSSDQATAQEKKELLQLIVKDDKQVGEVMKDSGVSSADLAKVLSVRKLDLNKDGQPEYLVKLEEARICGAHMNCPDWVYRKTGSDYQLILRTFGQQLLSEKTSTNKFRDLRSEGSDTAIESSFTIFKFDGNKYQAKACYTVTSAGKGRKAKTVPVKCQENE
ncbi:MAG: hypothetical protein QOC96_109 [Acidobacteriota bacterium]|jgi:hypothetical protein|nr:hypothetical protein [Acidobacteriota bacterium]